jgi:hypothetical protein
MHLVIAISAGNNVFHQVTHDIETKVPAKGMLNTSFLHAYKVLLHIVVSLSCTVYLK